MCVVLRVDLLLIWFFLLFFEIILVLLSSFLIILPGNCLVEVLCYKLWQKFDLWCYTVILLQGFFRRCLFPGEVKARKTCTL